jgi:hypothetical protein
VFDAYMRRLFEAADKYVIIYAIDEEIHPADRQPHMYHRQFSKWITAHASNYELIQVIDNECGYITKFYIYRRVV